MSKGLKYIHIITLHTFFLKTRPLHTITHCINIKVRSFSGIIVHFSTLINNTTEKISTRISQNFFTKSNIEISQLHSHSVKICTITGHLKKENRQVTKCITCIKCLKTIAEVTNYTYNKMLCIYLKSQF